MQINLIYKNHSLNHIQIGYILTEDYSVHYNNTMEQLKLMCNSHQNKLKFKIVYINNQLEPCKQKNITGKQMLQIFKQPYLVNNIF